MNKIIRSFLILLLIFLFVISVSGCSKGTISDASSTDQQLDSAYSLAAKIPLLKSLVISKDGAITREQYFGTGGADLPHDVRSVTKSVMALLIGIAIEQGYISSADDKISKYLSAVTGNFPADKEDITIMHLLTMSGGFQWNELSNVSEYNNWITASN